MKRMKTYKQFNEGWFSKKKETPKRMNAKEFIEWVITNYKSFENNKNYYHFNISSTYGWSVSYSDSNNDYHVSIDNKDGEYCLTDFNDENGNMGEMDPTTHKYKVFKTDITKEEYDRYIKEIEVIDEYLDVKDEEKHAAKQPSISADGELLNVKQDPLEEANYQITNELRKYVGKEFEFDTDYVIWTSDSTNNSREKEIETTILKVKEFQIDFYGVLDKDTKPRLYGKIIADWSSDGKEYSIMIEDTYKPEWVDMNKDKSSKNTLRPHTTEKKTRRSEKEFWKSKDKYPLLQLFSMTPSKYNSIEMLSDFVSIIKMANDSLNMI